MGIPTCTFPLETEQKPWYINAAEYRDEFVNGVYGELSDDPGWNRANAIIDLFDSAPEADVAPIVHARWIGSGEDVYCSNPDCHCHPLKGMDADTVFYWSFKPPYCPHCGAKMDGGKTDNE